MSPRSLSARLRATAEVDVTALYGSIKQPILSIGFQDDRVVPRLHLDELLQAQPLAKSVVIPGGHLAMFNQSEPYAAAIVDFIRARALPRNLPVAADSTCRNLGS